ncbi:MAG: hypothetical protein GF375_00220 [Candidatus Omnitrophica bacterium]|nr:hypothetical protein [Candidatus Omnitrophota bacterium]MBD3268593.1 hypothetical protein [Candidatus Omnitrophota bacterium]
MASHIKETLKKFFKKKDEEVKKYEIIGRKIEQILDEETKKYIHISSASEKEVVFVSDASSATYNFNLKKDELLKEIRKEFPKIKNLKVRIENG